MSKYRIVFNGKDFRIQWKWFCWWIFVKRFYGEVGIPLEFETLQAAEQWLSEQNKHDEILARPWRPV